jgi:hypothetical protein
VSVLVTARESGSSGYWMMWRVGRHRLAWRPDRWLRFPAPGSEYDRWDGGHDMYSWIGSLICTPAVLVWRAFTGRWPVVAYVILPYDGDLRLRRTPPIRRAEANVLVRQWAEEIKRYGEPRYPARP